MLRALNERTVLEAIRSGAPISRAEISRRVGISKPTVSLALRSLLEASLVREADGDSRGRYGATLYETVPEARLVLGLDMGARFLRAAICDLHGQVRARQDIETSPEAGVFERLDMAAGLRDRLITAASGLSASAIDGVVLAVPGVVHPSGVVNLAGNIAGLDGLDVGRELETRTGLRTSVHNDINLAAVGERWRGVGQGVDNFAFVSVGTGLGAGLILRGDLVVGQHGAAGEIDFAVRGGHDDLGARPISMFAQALAERGDVETALRQPYAVPDIFAAARAGDELARAVVREAAARIATYVLPIAAVADVELVVLGGGIGVNGDLLLEPITEELTRHLPFPPRVEVSSLGDAAVLTGALAVGLTTALENAFADRG